MNARRSKKRTRPEESTERVEVETRFRKRVRATGKADLVPDTVGNAATPTNANHERTEPEKSVDEQDKHVDAINEVLLEVVDLSERNAQSQLFATVIPVPGALTRIAGNASPTVEEPLPSTPVPIDPQLLVNCEVCFFSLDTPLYILKLSEAIVN